MTKSEIIQLLTKKNKSFLDVFPSLTEEQFTSSKNGKWSPAQQLDHIIRAVDPVVLAFSLPLFVPRIVFGKVNRPSRTYDALVAKYKAKLAAGGKASARFLPKAIAFQNREAAMNKISKLIQKLNSKTEMKSEQELDITLLPHPLLGKLTFREMLYFTAYHAEHHEKATRKNLA